MKIDNKQNKQKQNSNKSLIILVLLVIIILLIWFIAYLATDNNNNASSTTSESKNSSTESTTETSENSTNTTELPDCCTIDANGNTVSSGDAQSNKNTTIVDKTDTITDVVYTEEQQKENLQDALSYTMKLDDIQINYSTVDENNIEHEKVILLRHGIIYEDGENTGITMIPSDILTDLYPNIDEFINAKYERTVDGYDVYNYEVKNKIYQVNTSRNNDGQLFIKSIFEKYKDNQENYISYVGIRDKSDFPD